MREAIAAFIRNLVECRKKHPVLRIWCERIVGHSGKCKGVDHWSGDTEEWKMKS